MKRNKIKNYIDFTCLSCRICWCWCWCWCLWLFFSFACTSSRSIHPLYLSTYHSVYTMAHVYKIIIHLPHSLYAPVCCGLWCMVSIYIGLYVCMWVSYNIWMYLKTVHRTWAPWNSRIKYRITRSKNTRKLNEILLSFPFLQHYLIWSNVITFLAVWI